MRRDLTLTLSSIVKLEVDHEYAARLQTALDEKEAETDAGRDADSLLGKDEVDRIMVSAHCLCMSCET